MQILQIQSLDLYEMSCPDCSRLSKKVKVLEADFEFQIRKLNEDKSTQKALLQISTQKDIRKWQEKYNKEKIDREQDNKKWLNKIDEVTHNYLTQVQRLKKAQSLQLDEQKHKFRNEIQQIKQQLTTKHQKQLRNLISKYQKQLQSQKASHQHQVQQLTHRHQEKTKKLKEDQEYKESKMKNEYESTILGLRSEKNIEQKEYQQLKEQYRETKTHLITQIYELKRKISELNQNIKQLKEKVSEKQVQITQERQYIIDLKQKHQQMLEQAQKQKLSLNKEWQNRFNQQTKTFYERELAITQKYEGSLKDIDQNRVFEHKIYENNMIEIKNCIENRPSRVEDLQEILQLRQKLFKKQRQFDKIERQLRNYQLELQNKQDTYNKIFIPTTVSGHIQPNILKRKELKLKRAGKSVSTVRDMLNSINVNMNNLPMLNNVDKKLLPPKSTKIL